MIVAGLTMLTHRVQEAAPTICYTVGPAAADGVAKRFALGRVAFTARIVTMTKTVRMGLFPATALAVCYRILSTAAPSVTLFFPRARFTFRFRFR